jgi:hypothetical protein
MVREALDDFRLLECHPATFGEHVGVLCRYEFRSEQLWLRQAQFYVIWGDTGFTFTFTHVPDRFDVAWPVGRRIIARAQLRPIPAGLLGKGLHSCID